MNKTGSVQKSLLYHNWEQTYTAASHQGAIKMFWLHFLELSCQTWEKFVFEALCQQTAQLLSSRNRDSGQNQDTEKSQTKNLLQNLLSSTWQWGDGSPCHSQGKEPTADDSKKQNSNFNE